VIDLPIWLVVTFLILAVFVPVALNMMDNLEKDSVTSAAKAEAGRIEDTIKGAYYSGAGSTDTVSVSLSGGSCLVLGGEGSDSYCITILLDDVVIEKLYLQRPSVRFLGDPQYVMGDRVVSV
jgi:hypothetical protein